MREEEGNGARFWTKVKQEVVSLASIHSAGILESLFCLQFLVCRSCSIMEVGAGRDKICTWRTHFDHRRLMSFDEADDLHCGGRIEGLFIRSIAVRD
jgi:hypothetical protein